jgi:hypothetical protein
MPKDVEDISPDRLREEISSDSPEVELKLVTGARHTGLASGKPYFAVVPWTWREDSERQLRILKFQKELS